MDVARKVLILARDAGVPLELEQIKISPLLPDEALRWSVDEFLEKLPTLDKHFADLLGSAEKRGERLFFSASIEVEKNSASIGVKSLDATHPFRALSGADNIVAFTTARYLTNPLVIKGPGAGAEVTAAGVFADMIRAAR
jgi:aspartokinase/homoserine dehydrogenase 1